MHSVASASLKTSVWSGDGGRSTEAKHKPLKHNMGICHRNRHGQERGHGEQILRTEIRDGWGNINPITLLAHTKNSYAHSHCGMATSPETSVSPK